ncbi:unnamed protein product [Larinioides sclopetarius]
MCSTWIWYRLLPYDSQLQVVECSIPEGITIKLSVNENFMDIYEVPLNLSRPSAYFNTVDHSDDRGFT